MAFELQQLRQMIALGAHGSFVRASKALHISQPALSRSIQALEDHLGAALFLRTASGIVPTDLGRLYIERARDIVRKADELDREAKEQRTIQTGKVAFGGGPYPTELLLGRAAGRLMEQYPSISLQIFIRNWDELLRLLRARELDFFVAEISTLAREPDIEILPMTQVRPLYFVARAGHPLAGRTDVSAADVFAWPVLTPTRLPPRIFEPMLAAHRAATRSGTAIPPLPVFECASLATVKFLLDETDSVTAAPLPILGRDFESTRYVVLGTESWLHLHYGLVTLKDRPLTQAATRFKEFVLEAEQEVSSEEARLLRSIAS